MLVEAITYRFRGHSMADPEEYRTKEQVAEWRKRDPIETFGARLVAEGVLDEDEREEIDEAAIETRRRGRRVRRRLALPRARVALRRRLRARRPGPRLVLGRRAPPRTRRGERGRVDPARRVRPPGCRRPDEDADGEATRRPRRRRLMAVVRYREALNQALREELQRDERVFLMGEDIGVFNGAFKVTDGPARGVRREARARHADLREHDRRDGRRRGDDRAAPGRRADDDQLLAAGARPDRQPRRAHPLHVRRAGAGAARGPHAAGRGPPARPHALALASRRCTSTSRAARRRAAHRRRRQGTAQGGDPRRQPGRLHRARVPLRPARRGARRRRPRRPLRRGGGAPRGLRRDDRRDLAHGDHRGARRRAARRPSTRSRPR